MIRKSIEQITQKGKEKLRCNISYKIPPPGSHGEEPQAVVLVSENTASLKLQNLKCKYKKVRDMKKQDIKNRNIIKELKPKLACAKKKSNRNKQKIRLNIEKQTPNTRVQEICSISELIKS